MADIKVFIKLMGPLCTFCNSCYFIGTSMYLIVFSSLFLLCVILEASSAWYPANIGK